ncbi:DUF4091 domain-containing protein [Pedobacter agri]|uniref:DUF4091 domain-containing protein n=1 Tax=Pedobacter agri TaxID=454586 RepID=UPI00292E7EC4|nr:glycoside hydrolase domain-containing protein [Pedobacter agri]
MRLLISFLFIFLNISSHASYLAQSSDSVAVQVGFISSDIRFTKGKEPSVTFAKQSQVNAWKGEKISLQLLVKANVDISNLTTTVGQLISKKGNKIASGAVKVGYVGYVTTDEFAKGCGYRKPEDFDSSQVTDPILKVSSMHISKNEYQPIWLSISIPENTEADNYYTKVTVVAGQKYTLNLSLKVINKVLPPPGKWKYDLDLWQHPAAIARVHQVPLWSTMHYNHMRPYYTMLAQAGQKNITTSIINEPWGHQTYDDFPSLIKWIKKEDGTWQYDYRLFDQYVSFVMSCGIKERINCYSMVPWKLSFSYFDEKQQSDVIINAGPETPAYQEFWTRMLIDFTRHLKAKGWFGITAIAMDERPMKDMQAVIKLIKSVDPNWKIALAGAYHSEIESDIFEYCIASRFHFPDSILASRKLAGKPSTFYTCCTEAYPNGFTFSPPAENVWLSWHAASKGYTGYLRWAYNSWPKDPLKDSRFTAWPAGDTYQVYPNAITSIRFEKLIEGIQDFEKIRILKSQWQKEGNKGKLDKLKLILAEFDIANLKTTPAADMLLNGKALLNE